MSKPSISSNTRRPTTKVAKTKIQLRSTFSVALGNRTEMQYTHNSIKWCVVSSRVAFCFGLNAPSNWDINLLRPLKIFVFLEKSHLSKPPSDHKQNGKQEKTLFSGTIFQTLSHDVFHFVASGSFKNHWIEASDWLSKNFNQSEGGFMSYHSQQNGSHHVKGYWKRC